MEVPQKTKNRTTIRSSNSTSGYIYLKKMKTLIQKDTCTPMFTVALFTIAKIWVKYSINGSYYYYYSGDLL